MEGISFFKALEYAGLLVSFLYLYFEFKQKQVMWLFSILCSIIYICIYIHAKLYADMSFSCFNICISVWGLWQWRKRLSDRIREKAEDKHKTIEYRCFSRREWMQVIACTAVIYAAIYAILSFLTDSPVPAKDAFNTTINIVGTWVLGKKAIEVWGFWFVANIFSVYLYFIRGLYPTMGLYMFYTGAAVYGFWKWKRHGVRIRTENPSPEKI